MSVDTDSRFDAPIDTADGDLWSRTRLMTAIDNLRDRAAMYTIDPGVTGKEGAVRAEGGARGWSVHSVTGMDSGAAYVWRGASEVVLFTDCLPPAPVGESGADLIARFTAALRSALVRARERHVPLWVNLPSITIDTGGTPLDFSGVRVQGLPGGTQIKDNCSVAGSTTWDCHAASGDADLVDLLLVAQNDIGSIVRIAASDRPVGLTRCEIHAFAGMATGAVRVVADSNLIARSCHVRLDRCYLWISGPASGAATTSIGVLVAGGDGVVAIDTTFSGFDEDVRVSGSRFAAQRCAWIDPANVYSGNGGIATAGVTVYGSIVTIRDSYWAETFTPIRVGELVGDSAGSIVTVSGSQILNSKLSKSKAGGGTMYPAVDWAGSHGLLRLEECVIDNATGTPGVFLSGMTSKVFGLSTVACRSSVAAASFHHVFDGGSPSVAHQHYVLTSAGVATSITNV